MSAVFFFVAFFVFTIFGLFFGLCANAVANIFAGAVVDGLMLKRAGKAGVAAVLIRMKRRSGFDAGVDFGLQRAGISSGDRLCLVFATSAQEAADLFHSDEYSHDRCDAELDLEVSDDSVVNILGPAGNEVLSEGRES